MAKWLNKYFSLGNNRTKSPPQPPRPDYREKRLPGPQTQQHSPRLPESDLLRAYRAQRERDFEDPYTGPGSSLRRLRAMCRDYCPPEELDEWRLRGGSPLLFRSNSERRPHCSPAGQVKYIPPKQRLIKIDSCTGDPAGGWSPSKPSKTEESKRDKVIIADDYSDPFDAKSEQKYKVGKGENGYMEPYEAQRLMTDIQWQEHVKPRQEIQLYDTPYEPTSNSVDPDSESLVSQSLRESKLPQDDDRPADEYDQPWEWNKALPALAAQFNGNDRKQSPSPLCNRRRQLRAPGGGFKPIKHGSPEFCGILGERVDPTVSLEKQIWYHGAISRTDAENLLRLCKECSYLVRNSQTCKHDYSLSLKSSQGFMHMKLTKAKEKYILGQNSPPFDSVPEVIHYYTTKKLPIKGAEHLSLLYPVAVRTL
ncbi:SH2 domain-containing adapter protein B [Microcaecilia unicolor]|uniref:SH2 domain-containing adapter protein B-like n=1 Tax=Microcaecilia unicolor TaxID=1415580 RepID=A0A6P7X3X8_9AMPH|nr:SH2 domain-containing adapter protein B-like [Microcaecilia unicolor]